MRALIAVAAWLAATTPAAASGPVMLPDLDPARWAQLAAAARAAHDLPDVPDTMRYRNTDWWTVADESGGDCEDKALFARARLLGEGWPPGALRLALAWTEGRQYHAVLTVDARRDGQPATYVIDPRFAQVQGWDALTRLGYRWEIRQTADGRGWTWIVTP